MDLADELRRQHAARFKGSVPADVFIPREENDTDKGIDFSLELIQDARATNLRTSVQLKAAAQATPNADGTYSPSVPVANVRYLLNGPCPLYVYWSRQTDEQHMAWAYDEAARLDKQTPGWTDQQ